MTKSLDIHISENIKLKNINGLANLARTRPDYNGGFVEIRQNDALSNFCGLTTLIENGYENELLKIWENSYNPSAEDILNGNYAK